MENYNITLDDAKKTDLYRFCVEQPYTLDQIKELSKTNILDVIFILEFGCIDIEVTQRDDLSMDYCVCYKCDLDNPQWETYDILSLVDINKFDNIEELEKDMFYKLINFAKEENLTWCRVNN